jgi:hypothetical protein
VWRHLPDLVGCAASRRLRGRHIGVTIFLAARVSQRIDRNTTLLLVRIAGILLTAIAVTLPVGGGTRMIHSLLVTLR